MRPTDFAAQLNVSLANGWGIVRTVTDLCMKQPEGKYVLVKDPNKVRVHESFLSFSLFPSESHIGIGCVAASCSDPHADGLSR